MNNFEDQLDVIRIKLNEKTEKMDKETVINNVNVHAREIAREFGIRLTSTVPESAETGPEPQPRGT